MENENSQAIEDRKFENKVCVVSGCTAEVEVGHLMCDEHFMCLSRDMQQQFYRARYKYEKRFEGGEALLNAVMQTCAEAVEQTIKDTAGNVEGVSADRQG
jgi:hypothetical protein